MHATNVRLDLRIDTDKSITVGALALAVDEQGHGRVVFEQLLESLDTRLVRHYCGEKYHHGNGRTRYQRAGTTTKTIVTVLGRSELTLSYVYDTAEESYFRPIEDTIQFNGQKRYQQCISTKAATLATKNSYRDATIVGNEFVEAPSASTINRRVHQLGTQLRERLAEATEDENVKTVIPDGTQVHSQEADAFHAVNLTVSRDGVGDSFETTLLDVNANQPWEETATALEDRNAIAESTAVVSDGEDSLVNAFCEGNHCHQFDLAHLPRSLAYRLWQDTELSLDERKEYVAEVINDSLHLKNSVALHARSSDWDAIRDRITSTHERIDRTIRHLELDGCLKSAQFLRKWKLSIIQFAEAALEERRIPWTSNVVERKMGTVSKRCKNQWMRWSESGLEALLSLVLVQSIHPELYREFVANQIGRGETDITIEVESRTTRGEV